MSAPGTSTTTVLHGRAPHVEACPCPSRLFVTPVRLLAVRAGTFLAHGVGAILSPGEPISVVFPLPRSTDVRIVTEAAPYPGDLLWNGVPARLILVRLGLPVLGSPQPRPFRLLALLPLQEVEGVPRLLRLGAEFLYSHRAEVHLSTSPCEGRLIIPA
jgi:hypothetical protein